MKVLALTLLAVASCFPHGSHGAQPQYLYVSWSGNFSAPDPALTAERSDNKTRWFDDAPRAQSRQEMEIGAYLPQHYLLALRYKTIDATHLGEASRYSCILFFCSWISGSILSGLPSNDRVSYRVQSGQIWLEKAPFDAFPGLRLRAGANVVHANLKVVGTGLEQSQSGILPLPLIGIAIKQDMFWRLSFVAEANYSRFQKGRKGIAFGDAAIGVSAKFLENMSIAAGVKKYWIDAWYREDAVSASLSIPQSTPFIAITVSY